MLPSDLTLVGSEFHTVGAATEKCDCAQESQCNDFRSGTEREKRGERVTRAVAMVLATESDINRRIRRRSRIW